MVQGSGFKIQGSGLRVQSSGFRVQGSKDKLGVWGLDLSVLEVEEAEEEEVERGRQRLREEELHRYVHRVDVLPNLYTGVPRPYENASP